MSRFSVGYDEVHDRVAHSPKYSRSCNNCEYFSKEYGDTEEVCQNTEVTDYDFVVDGYNTYCAFWRQTVTDNDSNTLFRRNSHRSGRYSL